MFLPSERIISDEFSGLAVALNSRASHIGIVYRDEAEEVVMLHLAFHHQLRRNELPHGYCWVNIAGIDERTKEIALAFLELVGLHSEVPYSFDMTGITFNRTTGRIQGGENGEGLTCASFIVAVLAEIGIDLIDLSDWPIDREVDLEFHRMVVEMLREMDANDHADRVSSQRNFKRMMPLEVGVAAGLPGHPHSHRDIAEIVSQAASEFATAA